MRSIGICTIVISSLYLLRTQEKSGHYILRFRICVTIFRERGRLLQKNWGLQEPGKGYNNLVFVVENLSAWWVQFHVCCWTVPILTLEKLTFEITHVRWHKRAMCDFFLHPVTQNRKTMEGLINMTYKMPFWKPYKYLIPGKIRGSRSNALRNHSFLIYLITAIKEALHWRCIAWFYNIK